MMPVARMLRSAAVVTAVVCAATSANAGISPLTSDCVFEAAATFKHPPLSMILILAQERGKVGECAGPNKDGSVDCGPAQVNSKEIVRLAPLLKMSEREAFARVRDDGCFNIFVSAYILAEKRRDANGNIWDAMGRYNSATPGIKEEYQRGLIRQFLKLQRRVGGE